MGKRQTVKDSQRTQPSSKLKAYCADIYNVDKRLVICAGLPSCGKTLSAIEGSLELVLSNTYDKLIIVRPVIVPACGLLPGSYEEKMGPYTRQAAEYASQCSQISFEGLMQSGRIEIYAADLLQGNRFRNSIIFVDEAQNIHKNDTLSVLSRLGEGSKMIITGDTSLGQQNKRIRENSMLHYLTKKFAGDEDIGVHTFYDEADILGDDFTKKIILALMEDFV